MAIGTEQRSISYQPALDGARAVAVTLVLVFHAGVTWLPAGYLGVSVFFTLSGYLITSLLLAEHDRDGSVAFGRFYSRRVRRLVPASVLCVVAIAVARWAGAFSKVDGLRNDVLGAVFQVFNWVRLGGSSSYADLFAGGASGTTSPLEHYWSLAIEEQFYWVWPVVFIGLVGWSMRRGRQVVVPVAALTVAFAVAAPLIAMWWGPDAAYWSTPARLAEILVGATLACLRFGSRRAVPDRAHLAAAPALLVIVVLSCVLPSGSGFAYRGGLPLVALVSGVLIWSLQVPGPVRAVLSSAPLVWVGRVSYGIYLFHWPVDVVLRERGWNLATPGGFAVALALTLAITALSYVLLERPIRLATWRPRPSLVGAVLVTACVVPLAFALPAAVPFLDIDQDLLDAAAIAPVGTGTLAPLIPVTTTTPTTTAPESSATSTTTGATTSATATTVGSTLADLPPAPSRPVRVLTLGDSTGFYVGQGLAAWAVEHPGYVQTDLLWCVGCAFMVDGTNMTFDATKEMARSKEIWRDDLPALVARSRPDVAVLMVTVNDVTDRRWSDAEGTLTPFDAAYRTRLVDAYRAITAQVLGLGVAQVVWVVPPTSTQFWAQSAMNERDRYEVQHEVIRQVVDEFAAAAGTAGSTTGSTAGSTVPATGAVSLIDVDRWMRDNDHFDDTSWRPDGTHLTADSAHQLANEFLGPAIVRRALGLG